MSLLIRKPGILTTVQDLGRDGWQRYGINPNGVMDRTAARLINVLLGNDESEAVLEIHFPAAEIEFETACSFAISGGEMGACLNDEEIQLWSTVAAAKGDVLTFARPVSGNRIYFAVAGGFEIEDWLGSRSTNLTAAIGGFSGRKLQAGDRIGFRKPETIGSRRIGPSLLPHYSCFPTVRVVAGGEFEMLTAISERSFLNESFTVTKDSNRMAFRLSRPSLHLLESKEMLSSAVTLGTIQLLPNGQMIVLMADHQTSGGYPRIANVIAADLPVLAQLGPGDKVGFHLVSVEEAEDLLMTFEKELCFLKLGVKFNADL